MTLKRGQRITLREFHKRLRARRWRRLVSADFIVDARTQEVLHNYQLLAIGVPSKRIERLHATLPYADPQ